MSSQSTNLLLTFSITTKLIVGIISIKSACEKINSFFFSQEIKHKLDILVSKAEWPVC